MADITRLTDSELATMIEVYVFELATRDFKKTRKLLANLAMEIIDRKLQRLEDGSGTKIIS